MAINNRWPSLEDMAAGLFGAVGQLSEWMS